MYFLYPLLNSSSGVPSIPLKNNFFKVMRLANYDSTRKLYSLYYYAGILSGYTMANGQSQLY